MNRKNSMYIIWILLFIINIFVVNASDNFIQDTLWIKQPFKLYDISGYKFEVQLIYTNLLQSRAGFIINNETKVLNLNEIISLNPNVNFRLDDIIEAPGTNQATFSFIILTQCGNNICDEGETCSSCIQDCGCQSGYVCQSNQCVEQVVCGDNKCSSQETCIADSCCGGVNYNLNSDKNNCGSCDNLCFINQDCIFGSCVNLTEYCGDGICNSNENCGTCIKDCVCSNNTRCETNKCVTYCGNGVCETNEKSVCKADCKWCGDGTCNNNETYKTCLQDCERPIICGDDICDSNEICCIDCGCNIGFQCINNSCIPIYECVSNSDCNTNETCVDNKCVLAQKTSQENLTSVSNLTATTTNKTTTQNETTQSSTKEEKSILDIIIDWFLNLFR